MKRCIKYHPKKTPFNFLLKPWRFYYHKASGVYMAHHEPIIYLKEFGDNVKDIKFYDYLTDGEIKLHNTNFFDLTQDDYMIISYKDGTKKMFQLEFYFYNSFRLVEKEIQN